MKPYSDRSLFFILSLTILVLALSGCKELLAVSTAASPSSTPEQPTATEIQPTHLPTQTLTATQEPSPKPTATSTTTPTSIPTEPAATELENVGGDQLIFGSFREGNYDIFVMNPDGSGQRNLTQGAEFSSYFPAWSPDRTKIAFSAQFMLIAYIAVMDADGSNVVLLTKQVSENVPSTPLPEGHVITDDTTPSWSPDGTRLVFASRLRDGGKDYDLYVVNADGTGLTRLTDGSWNDAEPSWSPDGSTIAFISNRESGEEFQNDIFLMNADGSDQRILVSSPVNLLHPVWSPDGTRIAYAAEGNGFGEIYLINADGTGEFNLTDTGFYAMDVHPAWSPDGERIAFMSSEPGAYTFEIYVINVDGTGLTNLTNNPTSSDHQPDW